MKVYLDNNSTTKIDPKIEKIYCKSAKIFGNANVIYNEGIETRKALNEAYDKMYDGLNANDADDIVFTSSTTEGNNAVIKTFLDLFLKLVTWRQSVSQEASSVQLSDRDTGLWQQRSPAFWAGPDCRDVDRKKVKSHQDRIFQYHPVPGQ